jgi:hypothetical protein
MAADGVGGYSSSGGRCCGGGDGAARRSYDAPYGAGEHVHTFTGGESC